MNNATAINGMSTGNVLKSYLVSIGVNFDQEKLKDIQNKLKNFANKLKQVFQKPVETIKNFAGKMSKAFTDINKQIKAFMQTLQKAFSVIAGFSTAILSASVAVGKFMNTLAKQNLELDNFSRRMGVSKKTAREFKSAVDSLGASVEDIQFNPELLKQYKELVADGRKMAVAGDYDKAMANIRSLGFEFVRLKNEANYVFQWVGYYLTKYLSGPMKEAKKYFQGFNEWIIKNTPQISQKIAEIMARIADVFGSVFKFFGKIGTAFSQWWNGQPSWIKNMMAGTGILAAIFLGAQNPLIAIGMVISGIFLLIDDYQKWTEDKKTAFGKVWAAITKAVEACKPVIKKWNEDCIKWMAEVVAKWYEQENPIRLFWENFQKWIGDACDLGIQKIYELLDSLKDFMGKLGFFYAQVQTRKFGEVAKDIISGQFDRDYEEAKQGNPNLNTSVSEDLIEQRMLAKNMSRKEAIRELRQEGKIGPRRIQESFQEGVKASQALNNPKKPANYNEQQDKYDHFINQAVYEVNKLAEKYPNKYAKVDANTIKKIIAQESNFDEKAKGMVQDPKTGKLVPSGALGLMQLMPATAKELGVKDRLNPLQNIRGGTKYFAHLLALYNGKIKNALYAYNGGMGNVDEFLKGTGKLAEETLEYPSKVLGQNVSYNSESSIYNQAQERIKQTREYERKKLEWEKRNNQYFSIGKEIDLSNKITTSFKQNDSTTCGRATIANTINMLTGSELKDYDITSSLLYELNNRTKNKYNYRDILQENGRQRFKQKDINFMIKAIQAGYPVPFWAGGDFSASGTGHFMTAVGYNSKTGKIKYADPNGGEYKYTTSKALLEAGIYNVDGQQGNGMFIPNEIINPTKKAKKGGFSALQSNQNPSGFMLNPNFGMMSLNDNEMMSFPFAYNNYNPNPSNTINISAINLTVNANSDNPKELAEGLANNLTVSLNEKMQFLGLSRNLAYG